LIRIAAPDKLSNAAKWEMAMSEVISAGISTGNKFDCVLAASGSYVESLELRTIDAEPQLVEFVIRTQWLASKNPDEKRVKSRTCIERTRLFDLQSVISRFLATSASALSLPVDEAGSHHADQFPRERNDH
jgi:hypothetical protein